MTLKILFYSLLALLLAAIAWSQRDSDFVQSLVGTPHSPTARIRFDNGSVRDLAASAPASAPASDKPITLTGVRKCSRAGVVVYTDKTCPPGSKELAIGGTVNVVDGPAGRSAPKPRGNAARETGAEQTLRDQYIEAATNR